MIRIGEKISDMTFDAYFQGKIQKAKFSDYAGKWLVLIFYPADFTFICPTELQETALMYAEFQKLGAEVMSVSTDTAFAHKAWHDTSPAIQSIQFPMVADPTGRISKEFGTYLEEEGLSTRGTFIINPDGILKSMEMNDNSIGRNVKETFRKLQASIYVGDHVGEVCPASWSPGGETLTPNEDLIGKI